MTNTASEIEEILTYYDLGQLTCHERNVRGYVNQSFTINTYAFGVNHQYFLRLYKKGIRQEELEFEHAVINHLAANGFDLVAAVLPTREGATYVHLQPVSPDQEEAYYAIFDYLPGEDRYTWVAPRCNPAEIRASATVQARFHQAISDLQPRGKRYEAPILELLPEIANNIALTPLRSRQTAFDGYLLAHLDLVQKNIEQSRNALEGGDAARLPRLVIHCDYHPGNLKFQDYNVVGMFDFDWSKVDWRCFDVALALFYFFDSWEGEADGELRLEDVSIYLQAYQQEFSASAGIGPLNRDELHLLPDMISAANLYVLNWTIEDFYHKDVDVQEYLVFLKHGGNFIKWFEKEDTRDRLVKAIG